MTSLPVGVIIQQVNGRLGAISNCGNNINLFKQKKKTKTQCPAVYLILRHVYDFFFFFLSGRLFVAKGAYSARPFELREVIFDDATHTCMPV